MSTQYSTEQLRRAIAGISVKLSVNEFLSEFERRLHAETASSPGLFCKQESDEESADGSQGDATLLDLGDGVYALKFSSALVTEQTVKYALPDYFHRRLSSEGRAVQFTGEAPGKPRTKRADAEEIARVFPAEVALLSVQVENLADYILFRVVTSN